MRRLGALLLCLVAMAAVWMLLVDTSSIAECSAGAAAALIGTLACALVSREDVAPLREHRAFLTGLPRQLGRVPFDLWLLARELGKALLDRHPVGRFHAVPFDGGSGDGDNARRAAVELLGSLAPNTIVLGVDDERVVVHQLAASAAERHAIEEIAP
jgi:multisubunit Na+/H+ antiporter MnhE subunit